MELQTRGTRKMTDLSERTRGWLGQQLPLAGIDVVIRLFSKASLFRKVKQGGQRPLSAEGAM
jgi:hypothetical protein